MGPLEWGSTILRPSSFAVDRYDMWFSLKCVRALPHDVVSIDLFVRQSEISAFDESSNLKPSVGTRLNRLSLTITSFVFVFFKVGQIKKKTPPEILCKGMPEEFHNYLKVQ